MTDLLNIDHAELHLKGIYQQRPKQNDFFVRLMAPAGQLTIEQLSILARNARRYGKGLAHFTTRQAVEVHGVVFEYTESLRQEMIKAGFYSYGAGGSGVRNVVVSKGTGPLAKEVERLAVFIFHHLVGNRDFTNLPKKFKISVSEQADRNTYIHDVGLAPILRDKEVLWQAFVGGGLGKEPALAKKLPVEIPADQIIGLLTAILTVFQQQGETKRRLKHLIQRLGFDQFWHSVDAVWERNEISLEKPRPDEKADDSICESPCKREKRGKDITVGIPRGNLSSDQIDSFVEIVAALGLNTICLTQEQNFLVAGLEADKVEYFQQACREIGLDKGANLTACPGKGVCSRALASTNLDDSIEEYFQGSDLQKVIGEWTIGVAGCPNSCSRPQAFDIGIVGAVNPQTKDKIGYRVLAGGGLLKFGFKFAQPMDNIYLAAEVPGALEQIAKAWQHHRQGTESLGETIQRLGTDFLETGRS